MSKGNSAYSSKVTRTDVNYGKKKGKKYAPTKKEKVVKRNRTF